VEAAHADAVAAILAREGERAVRLGEIVETPADAARVVYNGHLALSGRSPS
jgi:hypothetical protein